MNLLSPALENVIRGLVMHGLLEFISSPREVNRRPAVNT